MKAYKRLRESTPKVPLHRHVAGAPFEARAGQGAVERAALTKTTEHDAGLDFSVGCGEFKCRGSRRDGESRAPNLNTSSTIGCELSHGLIQTVAADAETASWQRTREPSATTRREFKGVQRFSA